VLTLSACTALPGGMVPGVAPAPAAAAVHSREFPKLAAASCHHRRQPHLLPLPQRRGLHSSTFQLNLRRF